MRLKLVICDLDGTLIDTLQDIQNAINFSLSKYDLPIRSYEQIRHDIGDGIAMLIARSIHQGKDNKKFDDIYSTFKEYYPNHIHDFSKRYPKVLSTLKEIKTKNIKLAVVSNKFNIGTQLLIDYFFPNLFDHVQGLTDNFNRKPSPDMVNFVLSKLNVKPSEALIIGDTINDYETAKRAGIHAVICTYGFRDEDTLRSQIKNVPLIDTFDKLLDYLF